MASLLVKKVMESVLEQHDTADENGSEQEDSSKVFEGENLKKFILQKLRRHPHLDEISILLSTVENDDLILAVIGIMLDGLVTVHKDDMELAKKLDKVVESLNVIKDLHESDKQIIYELKNENQILSAKVVKLTRILNEQKRKKDKKLLSRLWS